MHIFHFKGNNYLSRAISLSQRLFIAVLLVILACWHALGQNLDIKGAQTRHLSTNNGLSDLTVNAIYKDSIGYLYFGNGGGIDRFDGVRVRTFTAPGTNERLKRITAITEDGQGRIYAGNGEGLLRLNGSSKELERLDPQTLNMPINSMTVIGDTLYMGTDRCLFLKSLSSGEVSQRHTDHSSFSELSRINGICADGDSLWLTGKGVLHNYNTRLGRMSTIQTPAPYDRIDLNKCVVLDGNVFIATGVGLLLRYSPLEQKFDTFAQFGRNAITSIGECGGDKLYVSTDGNGLYILDKGTGEVLEHFSHSKDSSPQLSSNSIYAALVDDKGLMWVGYYQGGLQYTLYHKNTFEVFANDLINTSGMTVRSFAKDGERMLIGTRQGLHYIDQKHGVSKLYTPDMLGAEMIFAICKYNNEYYIGTFGGGIHVLNPSDLSLRALVPTSEPSSEWESLEVFALTVGKDGNLWIGANNGIHSIKGNKVEKTFNSSNSPLPPGNVYEIFFDSNGTGWFCTENGVAAYDGKNLHTHDLSSSFNQKDKYREVYEDSKGTLYFVPDRGPLVKTDLGFHKVETFKTPNRSDEYWANLNTTFVVEGEDGVVWIGTTEGLKRIKGEEARHISNIDGLPSQIFTLCKPVKDEDGNLWFGNVEGLLKLSKENALSIDNDISPITISQILINGQQHGQEYSPKGLELKSAENNLTVKFSDLSYTTPAYMNYEYKIDGSDQYKTWTLLNGISEISIYNMAPGSYTLRIRQVGIPSSETALPIHIAQPFPWTMTMIIVIVFLLILLSVLGIYRRRQHKEQPRQQVVISVEASPTETVTEPVNEDDKKYKTMRLSDEECKRIVKKLNKLMKEEEPYRNPELKIADLAQKLEVSPNALSFVFNIYMKSNYYDYINNYRIQAFKEKVEVVNLSKYTLTALSESCGFSSRSSFFRSFKKATGMTPAEYIKSLNKTVETVEAEQRD